MLSIFPKEIFSAALASAYTDVQNACGKQDVPQVDLMTHSRVRVHFARLAAEHVKLIRADNPTRNETEKRVKRIENKIFLLKKIFKSLQYSVEDSFLYFSATQRPSDYAEKDRRTASREIHQRQTLTYHTDMYNAERHVQQSGFPTSLGLLTRKVSVEDEVARTGLLPWQAAANSSRVYVSGAEARRLADDEVVFDVL